MSTIPLASNRQYRVAVLGGNGFVGQRVLAQLVQRGCRVTCFSRSGKKPHYLAKPKHDWASQVDWQQADGSSLTAAALENFDCLFSLVGAPPIPTLTASSRRMQQALNGSANVHAIAAAKQAGVKKIGLVGAHLPRLLRNDWFGYFLGKRDSLRAAKAFCDAADRSACVVQPGLIFGRRYLSSGRSIRLDMLLGPLQKLSFGYLIDVEQLATHLVNGTLRDNQHFENSLESAMEQDRENALNVNAADNNSTESRQQASCAFRLISLGLLKKIN